MRPVHLTFAAAIASVMLFFAAEAFASGQPPCDGPFKGRSLSQDEFDAVLLSHREWLVEKLKSPTPNWDDADRRRANLCDADLGELSFEGANLDRANLTRAKMSSITTRKRSHADGTLGRPASFAHAELRGAWFGEAELEYASFLEADLSNAVFILANLQKANFGAANLSGADFSRADVSGVLFEPKPDSLPRISRMSDTRGLAHVEFTSPSAVAELREALKKGALRDRERELTYALKREEVKEANVAEQAFNWVLFDMTSQYGMSPGRPVWILLVLIGVFAVPYYFVLRDKTAAGIWLVWPKERLPGRPGSDDPTKLALDPLKAVRVGLYFSLLSAASIGWKDLNVGTWLARIQADEYALKPSGWVRTVSGAQSLLSVYLLALWALTYFGRPFE